MPAKDKLKQTAVRLISKSTNGIQRWLFNLAPENTAAAWYLFINILVDSMNPNRSRPERVRCCEWKATDLFHQGIPLVMRSVGEWVRVLFFQGIDIWWRVSVLTKDVESDVKIGRWSDAIVCRALVDARLVPINLLQSQGKTFHRSVFTGDGASLEMRRANGIEQRYTCAAYLHWVFIFLNSIYNWDLKGCNWIKEQGNKGNWAKYK